MVFTRVVLYLAFISSKIGKLFLENLFLYIIWSTPLKFISISFFEVTRKTEKNILLDMKAKAHASVHFRIGSHVKSH